MVDRSQAHLIEIDQFLHHFGKPEADTAVARLHLTAFDTQVLRGIGGIRLARPNPMADDAGPDHIRDELIAFAIPHPDDRTRTAPSVDFLNDVAAPRGKLDFVLHDTGRPEKPHNVGFFSLVQAGDDRERILPQISRRRWQLPFLAQSPGEHLDFRADAVPIVRQPTKAEAHRRPPVSAIVLQDNWRATVLSDK